MSEIATDVDTSTTVPAAPTRRSRQTLRRSVLAFLVSIVAMIGLGTTQASAYTWTQTSTARGTVAGQVVTGMNVGYTRYGSYNVLPGIKVNGPYVTRNSRDAGTQTAAWAVEVYQWNRTTQSWMYLGDRGYLSGVYTLAPGTGGTYLPAVYLPLGSGTYRVEVSVAWNGAYTNGAVRMVYNGWDYNCAIAACAANNGHIVLA